MGGRCRNARQRLFFRTRVARYGPPDSGEYSLIQAALVWILGAVVGGVVGISCVMLLEVSSAHVPEQKTQSTARESSVMPSTNTIPQSSSATTTAMATTTAEVPTNRSVCFSYECLRASRRIQKLLNPLADPCRNWYEHVCGRFQGPQASVRQLMDAAVTQSVRKSLLAFGRDPPASIAGGNDARLKAAKLLLACEATWAEFVENSDVIDFMAHEKLDVLVSASANVTADEVFSKHVDLAFRYGLSGLMSLSPGAQMLTLDVDRSFVARIYTFNAMGPSTLLEYLVNLAEFVGQPEEEGKTAVTLHNTLVTAVAAMMVEARGRNESSTRRSTVRELKASQVTFKGVGSSTFGDAVESHTPYSKDVDVDSSYIVLLVLEAAWKALTPAELAAWTAWTVLHECASIAVTYLSAFFSRASLNAKCAFRVHHVMSVPFTAVALFDVVTKKIQDDVTEMTEVIFDCLARNASRFLRSPRLSSVIVGFPRGRETPFLRDDVQPSPGCTGPPNSDVAEDFESLLAFECAQYALRRRAAGHDLWLPMLSSLSPQRQYFTMGCFKDCRRRGEGLLGSCDTDTIGNLRSFSEAFGCKGTRPACVLP
ncbi:hypothetical protein MTO96_033395 [Rhipicephalus appendiculatus]